jgi:hypothetical protein
MEFSLDTPIGIYADYCEEQGLRWFSYRQNNSGGFLDGPAQYVYIQAKNENEADGIAELNGLYFNGVEKGTDCDCCGDRWSYAWEEHREFDPRTICNESYDTQLNLPTNLIIPKIKFKE